MRGKDGGDMLKVYYCLFLIWLPVAGWGQIERTIEFNDPVIDGYYMPVTRYFVGSLHFQSLPKPLEICRVEYRLKIPKERPGNSAKEWEIKFDCRGDEARLLSDTLIHWLGPHKAGDSLIGIIEFIPLKSGTCGISFGYNGPGWHFFEREKYGICFRWCLNPDGELLYLGKIGAQPDGCLSVRSTFFHGDSIVICDDGDYTSDDLFEYRILVEPRPKIGDTSNIHFLLKARQDVPEGCDLRIYVGSMEIINQPKKLNFPIHKGETIEYKFRVIALPFRNGHGITLGTMCGPIIKGEHKYSQVTRCSFIFNNDSTLKYVNYSGSNYDPYYIDSLKNDLLPNAFPRATVGDIKHIEIQGDSVKIY